LIELRQALDARQMRYILDIVPNHCGYWHPWFQAARANPQAPEAEFFSFNRHPDEYASWLGVWTLPKLNYRSPELRRRMISAPDAVFRYWLQPPFSADGWRIDVANMLARQGESQLGPQIARDIRQAVKETNPQAYLLGENFFDASPQLQGDQWDAVMNYSGFRKPLLYWLSGFKQGAWGLKEQITSPAPFSTAALVSTWRAHLGAIPWAVALQQFNLLNSHDTPRLRTAVGGSEALHKLAAILLFTFPGVPCLYYGDEVGLQDLPRLNSRGTMPWDPAGWDHDLLAFYKKLIHLRRSSPILQTGSLQIIAVEEDALAYLRQNEAGRILVIAQRSMQPRRSAALTVAQAGIPDGVQFEEYFSGQTLTVTGGALSLPEHPQGATLWIQKGANQP
jgi:alpha-glucosidase